ncbi:hypothetical protein P0F65_22370 [Sphingomonas sp. I4]
MIATTSRAGFVLLPIALLPVLLGQWRIRWWWMAPLWCLAVTAAVSLARHNTVIALVVERLHSGNLERFRFWGDSWTAITRFGRSGLALAHSRPFFGRSSRLIMWVRITSITRIMNISN